MADMYDLESQIMSAWNVVDDLKVINEAICEQGLTRDQISNALLGLEELYAIKFERLFQTYENVLKEKIKPGSVPVTPREPHWVMSGNDNMMNCGNQAPQAQEACEYKCPDYRICSRCQTPAYREYFDSHNDDIPF